MEENKATFGGLTLVPDQDYKIILLLDLTIELFLPISGVAY
jgi:hypothetical protein